ncbi:MAG: ABC transporter ATP-binding protein [Vicinamibacterales bacterium]
MISVAWLVKNYGTAVAIDGLSFAVASGEILGLIGPNGAGKTSTLRCIAGIHRPTRGTVTIGTHDMSRDPVSAKRLLAYVADEPHLFEHLTVMEHLRLMGRIYGVDGAEVRGRELLEELELADRDTALPSELSRGMKQKVALACAFMHDPRALLLDEPLTGLDPLGIHRIKGTIVAHAQRGAAVIVSSHLLHLVEEICTRVLIINRGVKVADGFDEWGQALRSAGITAIDGRIVGDDRPARGGLSRSADACGRG